MVAQVDHKYIKTRPSKIFSRLLSYLLFEGRPLTTTGRWINPLVFFHFAVEKKLPQLKKVEQPTFILGTGRSGTTILGIVLSMHKDVGFLNEPKALWHSIVPNEDIIGSYTRAPAVYRLDANDASVDVKKAAHRLFGAYKLFSFSNRVVDKYPELIFRVPFVKEIFPDAKFIFLVRNGWDTCHSIENWSSRLGKQKNGEVHDWWGVNNRKWKLLVREIVKEYDDISFLAEEMIGWKNHTDMAAVEWIVTMREGLKLVKKYPDSVIRMNYEELCLNSETNLKALTNFLNLKEDEIFLNYGINTLQPIKNKGGLELHPAILNPFQKTMKDLGY